MVQSLVKDMNSDKDLFKANAIRTLAKIVDSSMLAQIDRYIRQAMVDPNPIVASSALMAGLHLVSTAPDVVRRWVSEVNTALSRGSGRMVEFHALALLHRLRASDPHAIVRLTSTLRKQSLPSPMARCLLIRYTSKLLQNGGTDAAEAYAFLEKCLRDKSEMVILEAARAMCHLPGASASDLAPAITVLHMFLALPKSVMRFSAVKTLSTLAHTAPLVVARCNDELEALISDNNRTIATLAITTLLKTGAASRVEALVRQVGKFMADIGDEFKKVVVRAVHDLILRLPDKASLLIAFLSNALRDEGGAAYKGAIVDVLEDVMSKVPACCTEALFHLCEFIEDCEHASLAVRVCHLIGDKGPSQPNAGEFVRFVYNRVILEAAPIRAAAITALAKFAARVPSLRRSIVTLLQRAQQDDEDEVRDRATLYLTILSRLDEEEAAAGPASAGRSSAADELASVSRSITAGTLPMSVASLQKAMHMYQQRPSPGPLTFDALPAVAAGEGEWSYATALAAPSSQPTAPAAKGDAGSTSATSPGGRAGGPAASAGAQAPSSAEALYAIPEFAGYGALFKSSPPAPLTETEQEYVVHVTKHVFEEHIVLDFTVKNTLADVRLEQVTVNLQPASPELLAVWQQTGSVGASVAVAGKEAHAYVALQRNAAAGFPSGTFEAALSFTAVDVDPATGEADGEGFPDEYPLEPVTIATGDYMRPAVVNGFRPAWEALGKAGEVMESYALPLPTVPEAVKAVFASLNMGPCEGTGDVSPTSEKHNAYLAGVFLGGHKALARMQVTAAGGSCVLKIAVRSGNPDLSQMIADSVA